MTKFHRASFFFFATAASAAVLTAGCGRYQDSYTETRVVRTTVPVPAASGSESPLIHPPPSRRPIQRVVAVNQPRTARGQRAYRVVTAPVGQQIAIDNGPPPSATPVAPWTGEANAEAALEADQPEIVTVPVTPVAPAPPPPPVVEIQVEAP